MVCFHTLPPPLPFLEDKLGHTWNFWSRGVKGGCHRVPEKCSGNLHAWRARREWTILDRVLTMDGGGFWSPSAHDMVNERGNKQAGIQITILCLVQNSAFLLCSSAAVRMYNTTPVSWCKRGHRQLAALITNRSLRLRDVYIMVHAG